MTRPDYVEQDGCHNCSKCFIKQNYDEESSLYCTLDAPPRPKCGSVFMKERFPMLPATDDEWCKASDAWDEWSKGREVESWGKCGGHEKRKAD